MFLYRWEMPFFFVSESRKMEVGEERAQRLEAASLVLRYK